MGFSNERMRTGQLVNWFLLDGLEMTPAGNPITKALPLPFGVDHLIGFNELLTCKHPESAGVHFFLDDYQFERFWRQPERYLNALAKFPMVLGPTFSLYTDFPAPIQRWIQSRPSLRSRSQRMAPRTTPSASVGSTPPGWQTSCRKFWMMWPLAKPAAKQVRTSCTTATHRMTATRRRR